MVLTNHKKLNTKLKPPGFMLPPIESASFLLDDYDSSESYDYLNQLPKIKRNSKQFRSKHFKAFTGLNDSFCQTALKIN